MPVLMVMVVMLVTLILWLLKTNMENSVYRYIESSKPIFVVQLGPGSHFPNRSWHHMHGDVIMSNIP